MDRRVLAAVAVVAVVIAVGLGMLLSPSVEPGPAPIESTVAAAEAPTRQVRPLRAPPRGEEPRSAIRLTHKEAANPTGADAVAAARGQLPAQANPVTEPTPEYRCRALGQQADLIDRLIVISSGGAVDEVQRAQMASRVAEMSIRVLDEGEALWAGDLSCAGISDVNLGGAADYLARMQEELDLDESSQAQLDQALAELDKVDWAEDEED